MKKTLEPYQLIERSIIKKYRKELWTPFIVAVKRYELVQDVIYSPVYLSDSFNRL